MPLPSDSPKGVRATESLPEALEAQLYEVFFDLEGDDRTRAIAALAESDPENAAALRAMARVLERSERALGGLDPTSPLDALSDGGDARTHRALHRIAAVTPSEQRYHVMGEVARGGMGVVWRAWDPILRRALAMKTVHVDLATGRPNPIRLARFLEEAQVTGQLDHPGVVPVHELGIGPRGVFFTMRLVPGRDLDQVFGLVDREADGWNRTRAVDVIRRVCETIAYAHRRGVIHRDIKPANVMVGDFGEVYVMDWGLARVSERADSSEPPSAGEGGAVRIEALGASVRTVDGDVLGTPSFMAPEQARGDAKAIGPAADVYALGALLYRLLVGADPYRTQAEDRTEDRLLERVLAGPPASLVEVAPTAPPELVAICERAMRRDPTARYPDPVAMAEDLRAYLEGRVVAVYETGVVAEFRKWVRRNRALAATIAVVLVSVPLVLVLSFYVASTRGQVLAAEQQERLDRVERSLEAGYGALADSRPDAALASFRVATIDMPDSVEGVAGAALAELRAGRADVALRELDRHAGAPRPALVRIRIDALRRSGRAAEADRLESRMPEVVDALDHYLVAVASLARHRQIVASADIERGVLEMSEDWGESSYRQATRHFRQAILRAERARALYFYGYANAAGRGGDAAAARELADVVLDRWPDRVSAVRAAVGALRRADPDRALALCRDGLRRWPESTVLQSWSGLLEMGRGDHDAAVRSLRAVVEHGDDSADAHHNLGVAQLLLGDVAAAIEALRQAVQRDSDRAISRLMLAGALVRAGEDDAARREFERAIRAAGADARIRSLARLNYAKLLLAAEEFDAAIPLLEAARDDDPDQAMIRGDLGAVLVRVGRARAAIEELRRAVTLDPGYALAHINLGVAYRDVGDTAAALESLGRAVELDDDSPKARLELGALLVELRRPDDAIPHLERVLELDSNDTEALLSMSVAREMQGDGPSALRAIERALAIRPRDPRLLRTLGVLRMGGGDWAGGARALGLALRRAPGDPEIRLMLGTALLQCGEHDGAVHHLRVLLTAVDRLPNPPHWVAGAQANLVLALQRSGRLAEALQVLRRDGFRALTGAALIEEIRRLEVQLEPLDAELAALAGAMPESARLEPLAVHSFGRGDHASSRALYRRLLDDTGPGEAAARRRVRAARAAALASAETTRNEWADAALGWLRAELDSLASRLERGEVERESFRDELARWREDPAFRAIRDRGSLGGLDAARRGACRAFWREVDRALADEPR